SWRNPLVHNSEFDPKTFKNHRALNKTNMRRAVVDPSAELLPHQPPQHPRPRLQGEGDYHHPFDMTVLNDLDRFHLVMDTIDRVPQTGERGIYLKKQLRDKLIHHKRYIDLYGEDLPEIRNWMWGAKRVGRNQMQICRRTRNWVRLGVADLFFFIAAGARGEEKAWNRFCPCQDGCALIEEIRRHELDNECQSVGELGALGAGCACSHSLSVYCSYSVENEGPLGGDYRNLAGRRRRVHRIRHAYAVCRPLGGVWSAVRSFSSLLDRNHCPFHLQHVREDRTV